jgi:hypothetical protein
MSSLRNIPCPTYSSEPSTGGRARNFARSGTPHGDAAKMQDQCVISEIGAPTRTYAAQQREVFE